MIWIPMVLMAIESEEDSAFIRRLYLENQKAMFRTALKIVKDEHTARDMVSDAYVRMIVKIETLRGIESCKLTPYIISIVRNTSKMYLRKKRRENLWLVDDETMLDLGVHDYHEIDEEMIAEAETEELREAMSRIHKNHKELLEMKYFECLSDEEIAEQIGIGKDSVRFYLTKARRSLGEVLKGSEKN